MSKPVRVDVECEQDIVEAMDWYEARRIGLGFEFLDEVRAAIRTLAAPGPECRPAIGVAPELGVRRKLVERFPYLVVFIEFRDSVRVIAVAHAHRRPGFWRRRI